MPLHIVFVCTGNICRSPLAEYLARDRWHGLDITTSSAGTHANTGGAATDHMIAVGAELGVDLAPHRSKHLRDVPKPDAVIAMEQHHLDSARQLYPTLGEDRLSVLRPSGVADPYGMGVDQYRKTAHEILGAIEDLEIEGLTESFSG